jgi:tetratricopeptide (TPR) repeat protein
MISAGPARRAAFYAALVLVLAGGAPRLHQAWSHRNVYLPALMQEEGYYESAIGLLSYQTFSIGAPNSTPRAWRGPIYPVFIAFIESFSPVPDPGRVRLAQAALATFSILLVFALGYAIVSPAAGLLAAALLAFDANHAAAVTSLNIHGFYSFLILSLCAALLLWLERPTAKTTLLTGAFVGLTLLCRSSHFLLVPFMAGAAWLWRPLAGPRWRAPALLILGAAMALAPMAIRNRAVSGLWLIFPDAYAGAGALFGATTGKQGLESYSVEQVISLAAEAEPGFKATGMTDNVLYPALLKLAVRRIVNDPLHFAGLCLRRLGLLARALWLPLVLGLAGLALHRRNRRLQVALILAFSFGSYCVAGGAPEHQSAAMPLLYLLSGCGGAILLARLARSPLPKTSPIVGWQRIVLAAGPIAGAILYTACLLALFVEARQRLWHGSPPALELEGRALAILRRQAEQGREPARRAYAANLANNGLRWAERGDCGRAAASLSESLLTASGQPEVAGILAACRAAGNGREEAIALATAYRRRPRNERSEFWKACVVQSERLGPKAALWLFSSSMGMDEPARRWIIAHWIRRAEVESGTGDLKALRESLGQIMLLGPDRGEQKWALNQYRKIEESSKPPKPNWIRLAEIAGRDGARSAALHALSQAESLPSLTPEQRRRVVALYRHLKEPRRADLALEPLLQSSPGDADLWLERAAFKSQEGERGAALAALARAEEGDALTPQSRRLIVGFYRDLKAPRRGAAALAPLLKSEPEDAALWIDLAEFSAQAGERKKALDSLARAETLPFAGKEAGELRRRLALAFQSLGEYGRALAILAELTKSHPDEGMFFSDKGLCEFLNGDATKALSSLETAIRLKPTFIPAYLTLGAIHSAKGRPREALKAYDRGLARSPAAERDPLRQVLLEARAAAAAAR